MSRIFIQSGPRVHFISGLPRSGSTVLAALLRQNCRISATITSPVYELFITMLKKMGSGSEFASFFDDTKRSRILKSLFFSYHQPQDFHVLFDTCRLWTRQMALIDALFPQACVICCVRKIDEIINSIERLLALNCLETSALFDHSPGLSIGVRSTSLMDLQRGFIGGAYSGLREAWFGPFAKKLLVLRYETLAQDPRVALEQIYTLLGEKYFEHDFDNVLHDEPVYDATLGMPGLHKVRTKIRYLKSPNFLPPDVQFQYSKLNFWDQSDNPNAVPVI